MASAGLPVSAAGVARAYAAWLDRLVFDEQDRALADEIQALGVAPVPAPTMMSSREAEITLARHVLRGAGRMRPAPRRAGEGPGQRQAAPHPRAVAGRAPRARARHARGRARRRGGRAAGRGDRGHHRPRGPGGGPRRGGPLPHRERQPRAHRRGGLRPARGGGPRARPRFLTLPGDVPCVTAQEIATLCAALPEAPGVVFVPSRSGRGTNAALLAPPDAIPLTFGEPSFANHLKTARAAGLAPRVLELPGIGLDVDAPDDLRRAPRARARHAQRAARCAVSRPGRAPREPASHAAALRGHRRRGPARVPRRATTWPP